MAFGHAGQTVHRSRFANHDAERSRAVGRQEALALTIHFPASLILKSLTQDFERHQFRPAQMQLSSPGGGQTLFGGAIKRVFPTKGKSEPKRTAGSPAAPVVAASHSSIHPSARMAWVTAENSVSLW